MNEIKFFFLAGLAFLACDMIVGQVAGASETVNGLTSETLALEKPEESINNEVAASPAGFEVATETLPAEEAEPQGVPSVPPPPRKRPLSHTPYFMQPAGGGYVPMNQVEKPTKRVMGATAVALALILLAAFAGYTQGAKRARTRVMKLKEDLKVMEQEKEKAKENSNKNYIKMRSMIQLMLDRQAYQKEIRILQRKIEQLDLDAKRFLDKHFPVLDEQLIMFPYLEKNYDSDEEDDKKKEDDDDDKDDDDDDKDKDDDDQSPDESDDLTKGN